jgi:hypothetical protein
VFSAGRDKNGLLFGHYMVQNFGYLKQTVLFHKHLKALLLNFLHVLLRVDLEADGTDFSLDVELDRIVVDIRAIGLCIVKNVVHQFG